MRQGGRSCPVGSETIGIGHVRVPLKSLVWFFLLLLAMAAGVGSAAAFFLWSLDAVTRLRFSHSWLVWLLPAGGFLVAWIYQRLGGRAAAGNKVWIEEIQRPAAGVPRRMAPLIVCGTLITHLVGGSAGREGTGVQMGAGIAAMVARWGRLPPHQVRVLLMAGVAAGFGAVFGTPMAGAMFAAEVWMAGRRMDVRALAPCWVAAWTAHVVCLGWGAHHDLYEVAPMASWLPSGWWLVKSACAAVAFGLVAAAFVASSHQLSAAWSRWMPHAGVRAATGGVVLWCLIGLAGTRDYLGLGTLAEYPGSLHLPGIFDAGSVPHEAWLWKLAFTVVTLAAGFKGGEVTPLFFIGAALGGSLATVMGVPVDWLAAMGFVAVFAGAAKTPWACTMMGMELFGVAHGIPLAMACFIACACSGTRSIYTNHGCARG